MQKSIKSIDNNNAHEAQQILDELAAAGGGICTISQDAAKGSLFRNVPNNVTVIDFRYGGRATVLNGNHPRKEGIWTQYSHLDVGLARNVVISDSITNDTPIENWKSEQHSMQTAPYGASLSSEDYRHMHNHYQNFLSEVYNFSDSLNGVAIWGDSGAFVPGAKSWGAFFSARSWPLKWSGYTPEGVDGYDNADFDAALVGIEVDVLNAGRNWADKSPILNSSMAKIGVQVVGFGSRNTAALEVRTEDSDDPTKGPRDRRGAWQWGLIVRNALHEDSTLIHCENGQIKRGVDMSLTTFTEGAVVMSSAGRRSGIVFDDSSSGEVFAEPGGTLVVRAGKQGVRVEMQSGEHFSIASDGTVTLSEGVRNSLRKALGIA